MERSDLRAFCGELMPMLWLWLRRPTSSFAKFRRQRLCATYQEIARLRPGEKSVYAKILGSIPAEESDEEFEAAVAALR